MSVPSNDPQFRWGPLGEFTWWLNDPAHSRARKIAEIDRVPGSVQIRNESSGGQWETLNLNCYSDVSLSVSYLDENSTHFLDALLSWAFQGNPFRFAFDRTFDGAIGHITQNIQPGDNRIYTDGVFPANAIFEAVLFNHIGEFEKVEVRNLDAYLQVLTGAPSYSRITHSYTANQAIVKCAWYWHVAKADRPTFPIKLRPGLPLYNWEFSFRETMDVAMSVT